MVALTYYELLVDVAIVWGVLLTLFVLCVFLSWLVD